VAAIKGFEKLKIEAASRIRVGSGVPLLER
jgi:hypothetical protein